MMSSGGSRGGGGKACPECPLTLSSPTVFSLGYRRVFSRPNEFKVTHLSVMRHMGSGFLEESVATCAKSLEGHAPCHARRARLEVYSDDVLRDAQPGWVHALAFKEQRKTKSNGSSLQEEGDCPAIE